MEQNQSSSVQEAVAPVLQPYVPNAPTDAVPSYRTQVRLWSALIFLLSGAMLTLGAWMTPSPHGLGTHSENLHLPPCGLYLWTGIPCPTCGCTTAVTWLAHGHVIKAVAVQPFGAVVGLLGIAGVVLGGIGLVSGRWLWPQPFWVLWHWRTIIIVGGLLVGGAWIYKIAMVWAGFN
jgi:hypothetical protein